MEMGCFDKSSSDAPRVSLRRASGGAGKCRQTDSIETTNVFRLMKNDLYFIVAHLFRLMAEITTYILHVAFVSPHGLKNDECYTCGALFSPHGYKNDVHLCVARLFRLMA